MHFAFNAQTHTIRYISANKREMLVASLIINDCLAKNSTSGEEGSVYKLFTFEWRTSALCLEQILQGEEAV